VFKALLPALAIFAIAWSAFGDTPPAKSGKRQHRAASSTSRTRAKKSAHGTASRTPASRSAKARPTGARTTKAAARRKGKSRRASRSYQQAPSPERYKEIQHALASKGYFEGEPTGEWGPDSVEALKRFQTGQNLTPDGKINSLSLIALGLGPKRLSAKSDSAPLPAPPQ
jgi:peptidoglycan hydrolase-like protein with peptidoglycan-binding domain